MADSNDRLEDIARDFMLESARVGYSYNFSWLSRPIIQYPTDIVGLQEVIWEVNPDVVIETGVAHGGSVVFSASILALLEYRDCMLQNRPLDPRSPERFVVGVDIELRPENRLALENHVMWPRIRLIEGSSIASEVIEVIQSYISDAKVVLVILDSNHTHDHVLSELKLYSRFVTPGSYCIVLDTVIEHLPSSVMEGKPWCKGNSPLSAVRQFLRENNEFRVDRLRHSKLAISVAPDGFLKRSKS